MSTFYIKNIKESNRLKKKICENCMEELKGVFSDDQLKKFEESFYKATADVVLEKKEDQGREVLEH